MVNDANTLGWDTLTSGHHFAIIDCEGPIHYHTNTMGPSCYISALSVKKEVFLKNLAEQRLYGLVLFTAVKVVSRIVTTEKKAVNDYDSHL